MTILGGKTRRRGMSLVEMLVALTLTATLLSAVAVATNASFTTFDQNQKMATAAQTVRFILGRVSDEIRTADAVTLDSATKLTIVPTANAQGLTLIVYELSNGTIYMRRTVNGAQASYPLLDPTDEAKLNSFTFTSQMGVDSKGLTCTRSVTAEISLTVGNQSFSATASAAPRRNQTF